MRLKDRRLWASVFAVVVVFGLGAATCGGGDSKADDQRRASVHARADAFERAQAAAPLPHTKNFPLRKALVEMTERQDAVNHPWYIYILADTGNIIGYYVAKTVPVNACDFLSSTEDVQYDDDGNVVLTAPSLDGMFYGGAGASSGCDAWFFFDAATNALIQIRGVHFFSTDQPLRVEAQPISVQR